MQSKELRAEDATPLPLTSVDTSKIGIWRSPNTPTVTKGKKTPPDLAAVYALMRKAQQAIFFAVFLPSQQGLNSIVEQAFDMGEGDTSLLVYGAVSDPKVMPNYVPPSKGR